jgi:hypothetical protein
MIDEAVRTAGFLAYGFGALPISRSYEETNALGHLRIGN